MQNEWFYIIEAALIGIGVIVTIWTYGRSKLSKETFELMQRNKKAQDDAIKLLQDSDTQKTEKIAHLTGQVDLLKDIPLQKISESMASLSKSHEMLTTYMGGHDEAVEQGVNRIITHIDKVMADKHA